MSNEQDTEAAIRAALLADDPDLAEALRASIQSPRGPTASQMKPQHEQEDFQLAAALHASIMVEAARQPKGPPSACTDADMLRRQITAIRDLVRRCHIHQRDELLVRVDAMLEATQKAQMSIAVVGNVKGGKSTLNNYVLQCGLRAS